MVEQLDTHKEREENRKFAFAQDNIEKNLYHTRWDSIKKLNKHLDKYFGITASKVDKSGTITDWALIAGINESWGYVDIYYTKGYSGIFITEVSVCDE